MSVVSGPLSVGARHRMKFSECRYDVQQSTDNITVWVWGHWLGGT